MKPAETLTFGKSILSLILPKNLGHALRSGENVSRETFLFLTGCDFFAAGGFLTICGEIFSERINEFLLAFWKFSPSDFLLFVATAQEWAVIFFVYGAPHSPQKEFETWIFHFSGEFLFFFISRAPILTFS